MPRPEDIYRRPPPDPDDHPDDCPCFGGDPQAAAARLLAAAGPAADLTVLEEGAAALHELYTSFLEAGFPEDRAFQLVNAFLFHALDGQARP